MCVERMRSIIIAIIIGSSLGFLGSGQIKFTFIIQLVLIIALLIDGATGFCPIREGLKKIFPPCEKN